MKPRFAASFVHRWHVRRSEGGYVLLITLAVIGVSLLLLGGLVPLMVNTASIEETGRQREREIRAAEGALDTAVNEIRNSASIAAGPAEPLMKVPGDVGYDPDEPKPKTPGDAGYDQSRDPARNPNLYDGYCEPVRDLIEVDGLDVRVSCVNEGLDTLPGDTWALPADDGAVAVRLVGGAYEGKGFHGNDQVRNWKSAGAGGFPFASAMSSGFSQAEIDATTGQLLHRGDVPLRIVGGLEVRHQIAAVTNNGRPGPAVVVQGTAAQGGKGMFGAAGSEECGIAEEGDPFGATRADVRVRSAYDRTGELGLLCSVDELEAMGAGGLPPGSGDWTNAQVWGSRIRVTQPGGLPEDYPLPKDCEVISQPGDIISLSGTFNRWQTRILNAWWSDTDYPNDPTLGPCPGRTFLFEGGDLWFDVWDPSVPGSDPRRHSLVFDNREIKWVFGKPDGTWNPSAGQSPPLAQFPAVCARGNASAADGSMGASITLSSRTGLHHGKGRVSICGPIGVGGTHGTAIAQRSAAALGARLLPTGLTPGNFTASSTAVSAIQSRGGDVITAVEPMTPAKWDTTTGQYPKTFTATGFGEGAPNGEWPGPGPLGSVFVDLTGTTQFGNQSLAYTRFVVTLADGRSCDTGVPSGTSPFWRIPNNLQTVTYNLSEANADSDCDEFFTGGSVNRDDMRNATIAVTLVMNPPRQQNTAWGWFNWLCQGLAAVGNWTGWWNLGCDNRPPQISVSVDAIELRLSWTPERSTPVNDSDTTALCPACRPFQDPGNGAVDDGIYTFTETPAAAGGGSFSRLRYTLRDPTLLDGFMPLSGLRVTTRVIKPAVSSPGDKVEFVIRTHTGVECRQERLFSALPNGATNVDFNLGQCTRNGVPLSTVPPGGVQDRLDIGELVTVTTDGTEFPTTLDVEVNMANTGQVRRFEIDHATVTVTALDPFGYLRPQDPFTVTWNPLTPNNDGTGRPGDATFNVLGSVSVPTNDVRVRWNWGGANAAGPLGHPIFTAGRVTFDQCNPFWRAECKPALVAGALGSWTTGTWPTNPTSAQLPDALASTGETRKPVRRVLLTACVVDRSGGQARLLPRAQARASIQDAQSRAYDPGVTVRVNNWRTIQNPVVKAFGASAEVNPCMPPVD